MTRILIETSQRIIELAVSADDEAEAREYVLELKRMMIRYVGPYVEGDVSA